MTVKTRSAIAAGAASLVALATLALPTPASADQDEDIYTRLVNFCGQVSSIDARLDDLLTHLDGDESAKGSLDWLENKLENRLAFPEEELPEELVDLQNRYAARILTRELITTHQAQIAKIQVMCEEYGFEG